ncbi:uncharacterized protein LOC110829347 [Zootermopsis nevadensis]|uniref:uncharacterized protein LOC110829347 n=1 Tax=Zootermopsis nevadensis TaxID=136037 RepID=UPI000B8EC4AA|nr:uncharacterized protein LOC110829347 [Zootermopsis nevadensis]
MVAVHYYYTSQPFGQGLLSARFKKAKRLCSLYFLLRCRDQGTVPHFLQFHHHIHSEAAKRIYRRTSFCLLRERIHHTRRELDAISRDLLDMHLRLAAELSTADWALIDRITFKRASRVAADDKVRQCIKLQRLHGAQHAGPRTDTKKTVVNLSGRPLEDAAYSALGKGLNYAVSIEDFLSGVERAVRSLPVEAAAEVRQETVRILRASKKPKDNLSGEESSLSPLVPPD